MKGKFHLTILLKDVFGFAKCQEQATYGIGYKLTLTGTENDAVIDKTGGITDARTKINNIHWFVPLYTTCIQQQSTLSKQILSKTPTEFGFVGRSSIFFFERSK